MRRALTALLIFLSASISLPSQTAQQPSKSELATVYVYSLAARKTRGRITPSVYVDGVESAEIRPNHYFVARLEPGTRVIHFKKTKKRGGVELNLEAGKTYYLRVNWKSGGSLRPEGFDVVQVETARYDLKQVKPIDADNIKDPARISTLLGDLQ